MTLLLVLVLGAGLAFATKFVVRGDRRRFQVIGAVLVFVFVCVFLWLNGVLGIESVSKVTDFSCFPSRTDVYPDDEGLCREIQELRALGLTAAGLSALAVIMTWAHRWVAWMFGPLVLAATVVFAHLTVGVAPVVLIAGVALLLLAGLDRRTQGGKKPFAAVRSIPFWSLFAFGVLMMWIAEANTSGLT